jgi:MerR family copper efflux transcriptional regulator
MNDPMNIGDAARAAGVTAKMIRHYEALGLVPEAVRTDSGYRQYTRREVAVFRFIRQARSVGFSIPQIERLLGLWADQNRHSRDVKDLAREHIEALDRKMSEMAQMKAALEQISHVCHGDDRPECPILRKLSDDAAVTPPRPVAKASGKGARPPTGDTGTSDVPAHTALSAWMHGMTRQACPHQGA